MRRIGVESSHRQHHSPRKRGRLPHGPWSRDSWLTAQRQEFVELRSSYRYWREPELRRELAGHQSFLQERGLELSQTKSRVTHIRDGFDFLGQNLRKYQGKLLIKPSTRSVQALFAKVRAVVKGSLHLSAGSMVKRLNPIIRGWANYHQHVVSKETFGKVDTYVFRTIWRWSKRKHPTKSAAWRRKKYFRAVGTRNWVFTGSDTSRSEARPIPMTGTGKSTLKNVMVFRW